MIRIMYSLQRFEHKTILEFEQISQLHVRNRKCKVEWYIYEVMFVATMISNATFLHANHSIRNNFRKTFFTDFLRLYTLL